MLGDEHLDHDMEPGGEDASEDGPGERQRQHAVRGEQSEQDVAHSISQQPVSQPGSQDLRGHGHPGDHAAVLQVAVRRGLLPHHH